jgi:hypothetical protein
VSYVNLGNSAGRQWVRVRAGDVSAYGDIRPRLFIQLHVQTLGEKRRGELHVLKVKLKYSNEELAEGLMTGVTIGSFEHQAQLEIPIERAALQYITDNASGDRIDLALEFSGWARVKREPTDNDPATHMEYPEPGEWGFITVGEGQQAILPIQIARSDWFTRVMEPVGTLSYVVTEIPMPKGAAIGQLQQTLNHLREAESKYATGDDAEVFFRCRAAVEALPGAPKNVFDALTDRDEAECMDALMKEAVDYLHRGRHTVREGEQRGAFPVDHGDACFALAMTRLLVAQTSRLLSEGSR